MILITITSPEINPNKILDGFLRENNITTSFIPVLNLTQAEKKKHDKILWHMEKLKTPTGSEFDYQRQLDLLIKMSTFDYVKDYYGFTEFNSKTNEFGYMGNSKARMSSYTPGEAVFITFSGEKVFQSKKENIDWDKMSEEAYLKAKNEVDGWHKNNDKQLITIRHKVHMRPLALINKSNHWYDQESFHNSNDQDVHKSIESFQNEWEKSVKDASPDDIFTHWIYQD
ncbi:MAG: hypothetical protein WC894_05030 [Patescibacteria group bacterium]